jgi:hypothetical protein
MAIIRQDRINNESISSINDLEEYINTNYLQAIQDKIEDLKVKKQLIDDNIILYNSLNEANNINKTALLNDVKYTTILNNQSAIEPLLDDINETLELLTTMLAYKDLFTLNNLNYKQELYGANKINIVEGEFIQLECVNPKIAKGIVNIDYYNKELAKMEQPPKPLQPLGYLTTDNEGNLQWTI